MTHVSFDFFALFTDDCTCINKSIKIQDIKNLLSFLDKKKYCENY